MNLDNIHQRRVRLAQTQRDSRISDRTGTLRRAHETLRPWAGQDHPGTTLFAGERMGTLIYNISLIPGQTI